MNVTFGNILFLKDKILVFVQTSDHSFHMFQEIKHESRNLLDSQRFNVSQRLPTRWDWDA